MEFTDIPLSAITVSDFNARKDLRRRNGRCRHPRACGQHSRQGIAESDHGSPPGEWRFRLDRWPEAVSRVPTTRDAVDSRHRPGRLGRHRRNGHFAGRERPPGGYEPHRQGPRVSAHTRQVRKLRRGRSSSGSVGADRQEISVTASIAPRDPRENLNRGRPRWGRGDVQALETFSPEHQVRVLDRIGGFTQASRSRSSKSSAGDIERLRATL